MELTHLDKETTDGTVRNMDALYQLFPSCFTEAKDAISGDMRRVVDWGKLRISEINLEPLGLAKRTKFVFFC